MDFREPAERLGRQVRAYTPWPGTHTTWEGRRLKLLEVAPLGASSVTAQPGRSYRSRVGAGPRRRGDRRRTLGLLRVQIEGRQPVAVRDFLAGHAAFVGATLPS